MASAADLEEAVVGLSAFDQDDPVSSWVVVVDPDHADDIVHHSYTASEAGDVPSGYFVGDHYSSIGLDSVLDIGPVGRTHNRFDSRADLDIRRTVVGAEEACAAEVDPDTEGPAVDRSRSRAEVEASAADNGVAEEDSRGWPWLRYCEDGGLIFAWLVFSEKNGQKIRTLISARATQPAVWTQTGTSLHPF